jgi:hypothetical protein
MCYIFQILSMFSIGFGAVAASPCGHLLLRLRNTVYKFWIYCSIYTDGIPTYLNGILRL